MKKIFVLLAISILGLHVKSQNLSLKSYPIVGEDFPEHNFPEFTNYPTRFANTKDFLGKWLILDVWGYSCSACIASFPRMDSLAAKFKDSVQVIMVGATNPGYGNVKKITATTKNLYKHLEEVYHLKFTVAYDSTFFVKYNVGALPQIFVINPEGKIVAKTVHIDDAQVIQLLHGKTPEFEKSFSKDETKASNYKSELPLLTSGRSANGGNDTSYIYRSMLVPYSDEMPYGKTIDLRKATSFQPENGKLEIFQCRIPSLYRLAYFGLDNWDTWNKEFYAKKSKDLILRFKDSSSLQEKIKNNVEYAYSLQLPKGKRNIADYMIAMQTDLGRVFNCKARIQNEYATVLKLETEDKKKVDKHISDSNLTPDIINDYDHILFINQKMDIICGVLTNALHLDYPLINDAGIDNNLTLNIKANMFNLEEVYRALSKLGFKITKTMVEMQTIVLTD